MSNVAYTNINNYFSAYQTFSAGAGAGSDMRFKTNIEPLTNILDYILSLDIFNYTWNKEGESQYNKLSPYFTFSRSYQAMV